MFDSAWYAIKASLFLICFIASSVAEVDDSIPSAKVLCGTTKGDLAIDIHREWSPLGADRFMTLVKDGFFTNIAFFRCVDGFLTQFGISDQESMQHWHDDNIQDDPNLNLGIHKNYLSYAGGGPNTRSTQLFIAFEHLDFLGNEPWETPFGVVVDGQSTLDELYKGYGDISPFGSGPDQQEIYAQGNQYIRDNFPLIDFINSCHVVSENAPIISEETIHDDALLEL
jgi:peptidyl-prolyl cis-trans isomerase A (cyclophilin A)